MNAVQLAEKTTQQEVLILPHRTYIQATVNSGAFLNGANRGKLTEVIFGVKLVS